MLLAPDGLSTRRRLALVAGTALVLLASLPLACLRGDAGTPRPLYDLARSSSIASVAGERTRLDFGRAESRPFLGRGWSWNEHGEDGTFVWSRGLYSSLELPLIDRVDRELRLRARPYRPPGAPPLEVRFEVNGETAGAGLLTGGMAELRIAIPAERWSIGDNQLGFHYSHSHRTLALEGPASEGQRDVAMAWHSLLLVEPEVPQALDSATDPHPPRAGVEAARDRLQLPCGLRIDFQLDLAAGCRLRFDRLDLPPGCGLVVQLRERGDAAAHQLAHLKTTTSELAIDLGLERFSPARLSLIVTGEPGGEHATLHRPLIVLPRAPGEGI